MTLLRATLTTILVITLTECTKVSQCNASYASIMKVCFMHFLILPFISKIFLPIVTKRTLRNECNTGSLSDDELSFCSLHSYSCKFSWFIEPLESYQIFG